MPWNSGVFTAASPPYPFTPNTPALAEDINATVEDLTSGINGCVPISGAGAWQGDVNANGHNLGGVGTLSASTVTANSTIASPTFRVTNAAGVYYSENGFNHGIAFGWDGSWIQGFVDGGYIGQLATTGWVNGNFATTSWVNGNFYPAGTSDGRYLYKGGDTCTGNLGVNGTVTTGYLNSSGNVNAANAVTTGNGVSYQGQAAIGLWWNGSYFATDIGGDRSQSLVGSGSDGGINRKVYYLVCNTNGTVWVGGSGITVAWNGSVSDRRAKSNIEDAGDALAVIAQTPVHAADYAPCAEATPLWLPFTLIADEVERILPAAVLPPVEPGAMAGLIPLHLCSTLWRAVQQLAARVEALEAAASRRAV